MTTLVLSNVLNLLLIVFIKHEETVYVLGLFSAVEYNPHLILS